MKYDIAKREEKTEKFMHRRWFGIGWPTEVQLHLYLANIHALAKPGFKRDPFTPFAIYLENVNDSLLMTEFADDRWNVGCRRIGSHHKNMVVDNFGGAPPL